MSKGSIVFVDVASAHRAADLVGKVGAPTVYFGCYFQGLSCTFSPAVKITLKYALVNVIIYRFKRKKTLPVKSCGYDPRKSY